MNAKEIKQLVTEALENHFGKINDLHKQTLDVYELSKYINLSPSYIRKLVSQGKIPRSKPWGKRLYFNKLEIDQYIASKSSGKFDADSAADDYFHNNSIQNPLNK